MSRSQPNDRSSNPSTRWFEWSGEDGIIRYYDKTEGKNIEVGEKFTFILLDELATIKGWHDSSESGIYSNEVRDTVQEAFVVKAFKGGTIAQGIYRQIRDRIAAAGGKFVNNCYIAYKPDKDSPTMVIGSVQFKGAALNAWVDFKKANRTELMKKAVAIIGKNEGKKGSIKFFTPKFAIKEITPETNETATALDTDLQTYLKSYFARTRSEQVNPSHEVAEEDRSQEREPEPDELHGRRQKPLADPDLDAAAEDDLPY